MNGKPSTSKANGAIGSGTPFWTTSGRKSRLQIRRRSKYMAINRYPFNRRNLIRAATGLGMANLLAHTAHADAGDGDLLPEKTAQPPVLTAAEQSDVEKGIGKKGRWVEAESLYTVPLPRNDLKVSIKGE